MSAAGLPVTAAVPADWRLPDRGVVGMWCLIIAESAIFTIFVVAYVYYLGKNLSGPEPRDILELPIFISLCLWAAASPWSSRCAAARGRSAWLLAGHARPRPRVHGRHGAGWHHLI